MKSAKGNSTLTINLQKESKNVRVLLNFIAYCIEHPGERFWQALRNWSGYHWIYAQPDSPGMEDTFYWEGRRGYED